MEKAFLFSKCPSLQPNNFILAIINFVNKLNRETYREWQK